MTEHLLILATAALCALLGYLLGLLQRPADAGPISPVAMDSRPAAALPPPFLGACLVCGVMCPATVKSSHGGGVHLLAECDRHGGSVWPMTVQS